MSTRSRLDKVRAHLKEQGSDAFLVTSALNRRYLSGFTGSAGWVLVTAGKDYILADFRYFEQVKAQAPHLELVECEDLLESFAELAKRLGLKRISYEGAHTSVKEQARREEAVPGAEWVMDDGLIERLRAVKEPEEIRSIEQAVRLADEAFEYIRTRLEGRSEREVALDLEFFLRKAGGERLAFPSIVASGPNGALPHAAPSERVIAPGDLVTLDFGTVVDGYASDITRTVAVGRVDARGREVYALVLAAQEEGLRSVRPGLSGKEVDARARKVIEDAGYGDYFGHGLGHGLGLDVHEDPPRLSKRGTAILQPGMVTSVEPGVYIPGWGGVRIEDLVVVTDEGCRVLTKAPKELIVV